MLARLTIQTFLPYPDIAKSVGCLDRMRLGKQRIEARQIWKALMGYPSGWKNHPAIKMWRGYDWFLSLYYNACIDEWVSRGYRNTMHKYYVLPQLIVQPWWWGMEEFHLSHREALMAKNPEWYSRFRWNVTPRIAYIWPVIKTSNVLQ